MDFREAEAGSCGSVDPRRPKAISRALHDRVTFATAVRRVACRAVAGSTVGNGSHFGE